MLSVNHLQILKEIQSLSQESQKYHSQINSEQERVHKIHLLKKTNTEKQTQLNEHEQFLQTQILAFEQDLEKNESLLKNKENQLELVTNEKQLQSIESEIKHLKDKIPEIEIQILELYEKNEQTSQELKDLATFFKNIDNTINEIENEVQTSTQDYNQKIDILSERIQNLEGELPSICTQKLANARKRDINPFLSIISNNSCQICGLEVSSQELTQIQNLATLAQCQGCSRLLIF